MSKQGTIAGNYIREKDIPPKLQQTKFLSNSIFQKI